MKRILVVSLLVASVCAAAFAVAPPVSVVIIADHADRADAARLETLTQDALRHVHASAPRVVTIEYYGFANHRELPPVHLVPRGFQNQLVFAAFTITDRDGKVLHSEWIRLSPATERQLQFHNSANLIAARVGQLDRD